ncbi:MAG: type I glyceraldehyde-3-phosphate dehydrogenase [Patescibacteria group bacterium]
MLRVAINGFGRIGRIVFRANEYDKRVEIVAINDPNPPESAAYLLKYDTTHGRFKGTVSFTEKSLIVNGREIPYSMERDAAKLPWKENNVDLVFEATGAFTDKDKASAHLTSGAKRVMITAPGKGVEGTFVYGVNHETFDPAKHIIFSNASCTTNCLAPFAKVLNDHFKIKHGLMTTIHAYTNDQRTLDLTHKDARRGRAAAANIIPTSTGAAKALGLVVPELDGKMDGFAMRVPVVNGSATDLVCTVEKETTKEEVNEVLKKAAEGAYKNIIEYTEDPIVSSDIVGNSASSIIDGKLTKVIGGNMIKVMAWYDNEWGYSQRLLDLAKYIEKKV